MFLLLDNSRIEKNHAGISFYEQDVIFLNYDFSGDMRMRFHVKYHYPGFGIILCKKQADVLKSTKAYLFKFGVRTFQVFEKHFSAQTRVKNASCLLEPGAETYAMVFSKIGAKVTAEMELQRSGQPERVKVGEFVLEEEPEEYQIGFYSAAGNTLADISISCRAPQYWFTSLRNTDGGRIRFEADAVRVENCLYDAQIEQNRIFLEKGKYNLDYKVEDLPEAANDLEVFLFPADAAEKEPAKKCLLADRSFTLEDDASVNLLIRGKNGCIRDLALKDGPGQDYVSNEKDAAFALDGSYLRVDLRVIGKVKLTARLKAVPVYELTEEAPYRIVGGGGVCHTLETLGVDIGTVYEYEYTADGKQLCIYEAGKLLRSLTLREMEDTIYFLCNVTAEVMELITWDRAGNETNVLLQKTFKKFVTDRLTTPVLVTDRNDLPFDLSASYREKVIDAEQTDRFRSAASLRLKKNPVPGVAVTLYGLNDRDETPQFKIAQNDFTVDCQSRTLTVRNASLLARYRYFAVRYRHVDRYAFLFTNYEREVFEAAGQLFLAKPVSAANADLTVYGIKSRRDFRGDLLYRVKDKPTSIDLCAADYDLLLPGAYEADFAAGVISLRQDVREKYELLIVDYLKNRSYAVNHLFAYGQYEIDISADGDVLKTQYDMDENGRIRAVKPLEAQAADGAYIVLGRGGAK